VIEDVVALPGTPDGANVTVLWRPGCPFCALLLRRLEGTGLRFDRVDIWEDAVAAAWVRSVADGNETVPTVQVRGGDPSRAVALVNPTATQVLDALARLEPTALPDARRSGALVRLAQRLRGRRGRGRARGAPR
jgi:glutaredoxin-like protein